MTYPRTGRHFLQIPGPTNVPDRVLQAISRPTIDHRGPEFGRFARQLLVDLRAIFRTTGQVIVYPSAGTGGWEAALVNTLSPGDRVLMCETGHFAVAWAQMAHRLGLETEVVPTDWRRGADAGAIGECLNADRQRRIRAVCIVHNETSTGATSAIAPIRQAIDDAGHPALLIVDTISSLASIDFRMDEWGVDVAVACSQKGLMLPPGLAFNAVSPRALAANAAAGFARSYWRWDEMLGANDEGWFPYSPATNLLFGLREAIDMLMAEGLDQVFTRHRRYGDAVRAAVEAWGLEILCVEPSARSDTVTAVMMPDGCDADTLRRIILERFDMSLGVGLGRLAGCVFRIGHLGALNELMVSGTLAGIEMGLSAAGIPHRAGGVQAALERLADDSGAVDPRPNETLSSAFT